ncbi:MAG: hypothetical protein J4F36_13835 [Nitrosopumilaceae archaeon]|nr:hypothetical protein [Nitrosopumilaceae archaeon]
MSNIDKWPTQKIEEITITVTLSDLLLIKQKTVELGSEITRFRTMLESYQSKVRRVLLDMEGSQR